VDQALAEENERWNNRGRLQVERQLVGDRPAGQVARTSPIVEAAVSVSRALGIAARLDEGSTDANIAISLGIPAITIDGGGRGEGSHTPDESFDATDSWLGTARALLLALALAR
jgi:di/tripeptidase